jgi:hypothetical protein
MKLLTSLVVCFLIHISALEAQTRADLFKSNEYDFYFYGIDYTNAKFIGDFAHFNDAGEKRMVGLKNEFFVRWNAVLISEREKYDVQKAFNITKLQYNIDQIDAVNETTNPDSMAATSSAVLTKSAIQEIVSNYNFNEKEGVGIVFIGEFLNKNTEQGCFHFVVFNLSTKEVLLQSRFVEYASGFGLRNYWISPIYKTLKSMKRRYKQWEKGNLD